MFNFRFLYCNRLLCVGSADVTDEGMHRACYEVAFMMGPRYDLRNACYKMFCRLALIGDNEQQCDLPEWKGWDAAYWNRRARGLGATISNPSCSAGDDNMRCAKGDRYDDNISACRGSK